MMDKVKVMTRDGSMISLEAWQLLYDLEPGSAQIGKYFRLNEGKFMRDLVDYGELIVNELLMRVMDAFREAVKHPAKVNAFNRDEKKQAQLINGGFRAASTSPHVVKLASDIDTPGVDDLRELHPTWGPKRLWDACVRINYSEASTMRQVANLENIKVRIGHKQYLQDGNTFIHLDVCPEYYAPGRPFHHHPHPEVWEKQINW